MSAITYAVGASQSTLHLPTEQVGSMSHMLLLNGAVIVKVEHNK